MSGLKRRGEDIPTCTISCRNKDQLPVAERRTATDLPAEPPVSCHFHLPSWKTSSSGGWRPWQLRYLDRELSLRSSSFAPTTCQTTKAMNRSFKRPGYLSDRLGLAQNHQKTSLVPRLLSSTSSTTSHNIQHQQTAATPTSLIHKFPYSTIFPICPLDETISMNSSGTN